MDDIGLREPIDHHQTSVTGMGSLLSFADAPSTNAGLSSQTAEAVRIRRILPD